jgi:hypothetical protein
LTKSNTDQPRRSRATRGCIVIHRDGVTFYGNKSAFRDISKWVTLLASSKPKDHYEFHAKWHLEAHFATKPRIQIMDLRVPRVRTSPSKFELTFMVVETADLDQLANGRSRAVRAEPALRDAPAKRQR